MAVLKQNIFPNYPYRCVVAFWEISHSWDFYITITSAEESTIKSAKIYANFTAEKFATYDIWINDNRVATNGALGGIKQIVEVDVSKAIRPSAGEVGTKVNKITFSFSNTAYPFLPNNIDVNEAYLLLEYTAEAPPPATPSTTEEPKGLTGVESLDAMMGQMMQFMMMMMVMGMMMSMMSTMAEHF